MRWTASMCGFSALDLLCVFALMKTSLQSVSGDAVRSILELIGLGRQYAFAGEVLGI